MLDAVDVAGRTVRATVADPVLFDPAGRGATGSRTRVSGARSPAAPASAPQRPWRIRELPLLAQVDVRADPSDSALMARLEACLAPGRRPSRTVPRSPTTGMRHVLWLGPDEWLVVGEPGRGPALESGLRAAIGDGRGAVVDVSANRTTLSVSGPRARDLLAFGCAIDLDERTFKPGHCVQTMLARATVILEQVGPAVEPAFRILVRPSFAAYLAAWLADATLGLD